MSIWSEANAAVEERLGGRAAKGCLIALILHFHEPSFFPSYADLAMSTMGI